ncbi:MAG: Phage protein Gp37/Gp68 [Syntrophorhabdus sp. PtaU1.Bin153]|nr:MAG: Phage protein Gp37/Gp68 [Syntrophorhabdus sp. PtaU1.Bin153]
MPTKIEWCDETWNPITGCSKISPGCENCYAERMARRLAGRFGYPKDDPFKPAIHLYRFDDPILWKKPSRVFVCSMGDLFHEAIPFTMLVDLHQRMWLYGRPNGMRNHTWLLLTKRPDRMAEFYRKYPYSGYPNNPNLWLGVTAENQEQADKRIPILLQIPAAKRFVSVEPMLGLVELRAYLSHKHTCRCPECYHRAFDPTNRRPLDWIICGGETGPHARPMHPDWVYSLKDQCVAAGVPFFFKGWGEWSNPGTGSFGKYPGRTEWIKSDGSFWGKEEMPKDEDGDCLTVVKVGKKRSGRSIAGREWNGVPE